MTPIACLWRRIHLLGWAWLALVIGWLPGRAADLSQAVLLTPPDLEGPEEKAAQMLLEEINKRTGIRLAQTNEWPGLAKAVVTLGQASQLKGIAGFPEHFVSPAGSPLLPEGYRIVVDDGGRVPTVAVVGNDQRGVLFGAGRLLRLLEMSPGKISIQDGLKIATTPKYRVRGHQLGYRPKCNSYDAWDIAAWEQYYRDLIVFGCNAVELIPPRSDDDATSPHFPRPPMGMMSSMSSLADAYGLDVWIWYPAMDKDYADSKTVEAALAEWAQVFQKLPRIDAVFVPGGNPGHTQPKVLMQLLERQAANLRRYHSKAQLWVSPQGFNQAWVDEFIEIVNRNRPKWLSGVVHGPQVRIPISRLRELLPEEYPIRQYPDITHSRQCQYPVPDWDTAYAVTEGRECIDPRPESQAIIFRHTQPGTIGFITYSEGCNDDVNKFVWSALGWEPEADVTGILRDYSRYFIGVGLADSFAQSLLALERNWKGPLLANAGVETTLAQFQAMERAASPALLQNWRFQQALFRAYYDAYTRRRLAFETGLETRAMEPLERAPAAGSLFALEASEEVLDSALDHSRNADLRLRIHQLAEALFQSIGMQLSVNLYKAIAVDRGAMLDTLDFPLNNRAWLKEQFARIRKIEAEAERLEQIARIIGWSNPGPGGFYDDLGNVSLQPHLAQEVPFADDPARWSSPRVDFEEDLVLDDPGDGAGCARRVSWMDHAESLYDAPLMMRYTGLDPSARYRLKVLYGGDNPKRRIRLMANDSVEIQPLIARPLPFAPLQFELPKSLTESGRLQSIWSAEPGLGGNGRGCQVSEVWLIHE